MLSEDQFALSSSSLPSLSLFQPHFHCSQDYKAEEDPAKFKSVKTGRGPLGPNWKVQFAPLPPGGRVCCGRASPREGGCEWGSDSLGSFSLVTSLPLGIFLMQQELVNQKDCPYMCAYKLVTVKFKWWGLQNKVENFIHKVSLQDGLPCVCLCVGESSLAQEL